MQMSMDPENLPVLRNMSAAFIKRLMLVPKTRPARREYLYVPVGTQSNETLASWTGFFAEWGMTWESGPYRVSYFEPEELRRYLPEALAARLEQGCVAERA